jgi:8-oxo-dGTP pyrophosphatase MutT (NUDIX family)
VARGYGSAMDERTDSRRNRPTEAAPSPPVRDAAAVVLVRRRPDGAQVLMGQRGAKAAFMPSKFVFPGGAVDPEDVALAAALPMDPGTERRLLMHAEPAVARGLALTAIRELWEETGLALGAEDPGGAAALGPRAGAGFRGMLGRGLVPRPAGLRFVFRAVTPPGRPRRFDARFFLADAEGARGDAETFAGAGDELSHLQWLDLAAARALALPFITEVVLSEVAAIVAAAPDASRPVPFFHHDAAGSHVSLV